MTTPDPPSKTGLKRGDVVLVPFPNSDLQTAKLRPALIVQANDLETGLSQIVLVMISTNLSRLGHSSRVMIDVSTEQGMKSGLLGLGCHVRQSGDGQTFSDKPDDWTFRRNK